MKKFCANQSKFAGAISIVCAIGATQVAAESCRQALALGLDISGSVDALEYRLQLDGLAVALGSPRVRSALLSSPSAPIQIYIYEWSGAAAQSVVLNWTAVRSQADIEAIQSALITRQRPTASPATALGQALIFGQKALNTRKNCWVRTLDISGDGKSNSGPDPISVRDRLAAESIGVNALVVGADAPGIGDLRQEEIGELASYFQSNVIVGPDAFVQTALGYNAYADAMTRKLEKELKGLVISGLPVGSLKTVR